MADADVLAAWLQAQSAGRPVEEYGATAVFTAISGRAITAEIWSRRVRRLTSGEQDLLGASGALAGYERHGILRAGPGVPVAETTAVLLPCHLPSAVRDLLGIAEARPVMPASGEMPLGRALRGLGVRREPLQVRLTPGSSDAVGEEQVIYSTARLWLSYPFAVVTERVYRSFLTAFPGPWPGSPG